METWYKEYQGKLGIALSDTYTTDNFLESFNEKWANLYDGVRQDSGNPVVFADKMINHYKRLGIDPMTKNIVFSDSLNVGKIVNIQDYRKLEFTRSYGPGTSISNDAGAQPLNMVIKLFSVYIPARNEVPVAKLSDDIGKESGDPEAIYEAKLEVGLIQEGNLKAA
jgi:nicotinate phosphoribosyltransferase